MEDDQRPDYNNIPIRTINGDSITSLNDQANSDDDFDEIKQMFDTKLPLIERWLREYAPQDVVQRLHDTTIEPSKLRTASVTSELFQQWLSSSPIQVSLWKAFQLIFLYTSIWELLCSNF